MIVEERRQRVIDLLSERRLHGPGRPRPRDGCFGIDHPPRPRLLRPSRAAQAHPRRRDSARDDGSPCRRWRNARSPKIEEKRAIARAAASRIQDGDAVLLDGGTTTLEVARLLVGRPVQIVTNSLPIANLFASSRETDLVMLGGYVYPRTGVALGPLTVRMMEDIHVHQTILSVGGITAKGLFNSNLLLVETERQMMRCADEVVVVADHTKFGRQALAFLCELSDDRHAHRRSRPDAGAARAGRTRPDVRLLVAGEADASEEFQP